MNEVKDCMLIEDMVQFCHEDCRRIINYIKNEEEFCGAVIIRSGKLCLQISNESFKKTLNMVRSDFKNKFTDLQREGYKLEIMNIKFIPYIEEGMRGPMGEFEMYLKREKI